MSYPLEKEIHQHIPLSQAMGFHIKLLSRREIQVSAPIEPNTNIHGTGFAGSIYSLAQVQRKLAKNLNFYPFFHFQ